MASESQFSSARQPRAVVTIDGYPVQWVTVDVESKNNYLANTYTLSIPTVQTHPALTLSYFLSRISFDIKIYMGEPTNPDMVSSSDLPLILQGVIDRVDVDMRDGLITLTGRDLSAKFIDSLISERYAQKTSSQIIELLAKQKGIKAQVTPTTQPAGNYYSNSYVKMSKNSTEWDLMTFLAQNEGFDMYFRGDVLYFQPSGTEPSINVPIQWNGQTVEKGANTANVSDLSITHQTTLARDVSVLISSYNYRDKLTYTATATKKPQQGQVFLPLTVPVQQYIYYIPGLSQSQAQQVAQSRLELITRHEIVVNITMPGQNTPLSGDKITINGVDAVADQVFYPDTVRRTMSRRNGYKMEIRAKNHRTATQVTLS